MPQFCCKTKAHGNFFVVANISKPNENKKLRLKLRSVLGSKAYFVFKHFYFFLTLNDHQCGDMSRIDSKTILAIELVIKVVYLTNE